MNESKIYRKNTEVSSTRQMSPNNPKVKFVNNHPSAFADGMLSEFGLVDNRPKTNPLIQRKIRFLADNTEILQPENPKNPETETEKKEREQKFKDVKNKLFKDTFVQNRRTHFAQYRLVSEKDFNDAIDKDLKSQDKTLFVNKSGSILTGASFVINATDKLGPNPENFKVEKPKSGKIKIETIGYRSTYRTIPLNKGKKKPGYVANIVSYYAENGVNNIVKKYFDDAISGEDKTNRLGVVVGLNSFIPIIQSDYNARKQDILHKLGQLILPEYAVNFQGFGFLWEPYWTFKKNKRGPTQIHTFDIRWALEHVPDADNLKEKFKVKQKDLFTNLPYGVFRETVMASSSTQFLVNWLKAYNNPVYIHSCDGDSISLKVPNEEDTDVSEKGILDKMDEHLRDNGTKAKIVIGGYNFYNLNEQKLIVEIVKADSNITKYKDDTKIDKKNPSEKLECYSPKEQDFIKAKVKQIIHNTQVSNRYDRIIRDAISTVYPKMLYPTEPNMLVKVYDESPYYSTDFFKTKLFDQDQRLKKQGSLWGMGASEGRVFKENLEKEYQPNANNGIDFIDWVKGASLPTDPRGFDRYFLISGYEKYPENKEKLHPAQANVNINKLGKEIPLIEAAVQQAQSYTSAYRLAELYAQTRPECKNKYKNKEEVREKVILVFKKVENMVSKMMEGCKLEDLKKINEEDLKKINEEDLKKIDSSYNDVHTIVKAICDELFNKFNFYLQTTSSKELHITLLNE